MARDIWHEVVKHALIDDGWTITHDPFAIAFGGYNLFIDLGAERWLAAERDEQRIAVEVKSFVSKSQINDLENAIGQFVLYRTLLQHREPNRIVYLAIPLAVYETMFSTALGRVAIEEIPLRLIVYDPQTERIVRWIQ